MKPSPDDTRQFHDPTGDVVAGLGEENLASSLAEMVAAGKVADEEAAVLRLRAAAVTEEEIGIQMSVIRSHGPVSYGR
jgi:hypothetical protein